MFCIFDQNKTKKWNCTISKFLKLGKEYQHLLETLKLKEKCVFFLILRNSTLVSQNEIFHKGVTLSTNRRQVFLESSLRLTKHGPSVYMKYIGSTQTKLL